MDTVTLASRRLAKEVVLPGRFVWELVAQLHELAGSWPGEVDFPDRYYSGPEGRWRVQFLIPCDMEESFHGLLQSFCRERGLTFDDPSGAVAPARSTG